MSCMWPGDDDEEAYQGKGEESQVQMLQVGRTGEMVSIFHYEATCAKYSTQVYDWLYLGNASNAASADQMLKIKGHEMTHCLNARQNGKTPHKKIDYLVLSLADEAAEDLVKQVNIAFDFLEKVRSCASDGKKVLVHCDGIKDKGKLSRSTAIVIGYLMKLNKIKYNQAAQIVKDARGRQYQKKTEPNHGFIQQLKKMYKQLA